MESERREFPGRGRNCGPGIHNRLVWHFIEWATRGVPIRPVVNFRGENLFSRYEFLRWDEWDDKSWEEHKTKCACHMCAAKLARPRKLPWWLPFNAFLHHWHPEKGAEEFHDHPRWSVTICLSGGITEVTPWGRKVLRPGSVVIRTRRAIHQFENPEGEVWTLFIVGRRKARQNTFEVVTR